jgi:hypothetical protein
MLAVSGNVIALLRTGVMNRKTWFTVIVNVPPGVQPLLIPLLQSPFPHSAPGVSTMSASKMATEPNVAF